MKHRFLTSLAVLVLLILHAGWLPSITAAQSKDNAIRVLLVYNAAYREATPYVLQVYESVLQEEGVPYEVMDCNRLTTIPVAGLVNRVPAIILPDQLLQHVPETFSDWVDQYLMHGGNIAVIYDVGVKDKAGFFQARAALANQVGLNYITYDSTGVQAYTSGQVKFTSVANREKFQIPLGKTIDRVTLSSYSYGALQYSFARTEPVREIPASNIYAWGITAADRQQYPVIVVNDYAQGKVLYVNLPLGYLKGYSDDLPLRSMLRTFLFEIVGIPHVMNVEQGRGGLVLNWHVDADIEHLALPYLFKHGFLRQELAASFHITAGDFFLKPGDGTGFDAAGTGKKLVLQLKNYGMIGSHGGWAHDWFSQGVSKGRFREQEMRNYIAQNNACLEKLVGYKITEYAAPNGVHPQPAATKVLEDLGMVAYYYAGDTGSAPNRVFYDGRMVSDKVIAFPLMPFGSAGSIWEMKAIDHRTEKEIIAWFDSNIDYIASNRTIRLIYSHPYDIQHYPRAIKIFLDRLVAMQAEDKITVKPMSYFAEFFRRFLQTSYVFSRSDQQLVVSLRNSAGLDGITIALPKRVYMQPDDADVMLREDDRYYYITVVGADETEKHITVAIR